jgi:RNA polymerase sigma-70 factor, ECF subfamily
MLWSAEDEKSTIHNARSGDPDAFQALHEKYKGYIYRRCLRLTRDPNLAEDLTQDVFFLIWRKISSFRGKSAFKTWLFRVATNVT